MTHDRMRGALLLTATGLSALWATESAAQIVVLSPNTIESASGTGFQLDVRAEAIPSSLAAAIVVHVSAAGILLPVSETDTVLGLAPNVSTDESGEIVTLHYSIAAGSGITELRSRIRIVITDDTVPTAIRAHELLYVPTPGDLVTVPVEGVEVVINAGED